MTGSGSALSRHNRSGLAASCRVRSWRRLTSIAFALTAVLTLGACASVLQAFDIDLVDEPDVVQADAARSSEPAVAADAAPPRGRGVPEAAPVEPVEERVLGLTGPLTYPGSDQFLGERRTGRSVVAVREGELVLNFENAELRYPVGTIFQ